MSPRPRSGSRPGSSSNPSTRPGSPSASGRPGNERTRSRPERPDRPPARPDQRARGPEDRRTERHQGEHEEKFHGLRACEALISRRAQDIIRVYLTEDRGRQFADFLRWCATERKGYQIVGEDNLERLTGSIHHEGIAILARDYRRWGTIDLFRWLDEKRIQGPLLYLDGVQNPHNLGSLLRIAAHFGVSGLLGARDGLPPLSPAAVRVAEGGAEFVPVYGLTNPVADLEKMKEYGFRLVTTSSHRGDTLYGVPLGRRVVIVLGSEGEGVSPEIETLADQFVQIPGTGKVESLNVAVAGGIVLGEIWRRGQDGGSGPAERSRPRRRS